MKGDKGKISDLAVRLAEFIRLTSSSLPEDAERALKRALRREKKTASPAATVLETILANVALARKNGTPVCQDTGTLTFFVDESLRHKVTPEVLGQAVQLATEKGWLRRNTIDSISGKSIDTNVCPGAPVVHYIDSRSTDILAMAGDSRDARYSRSSRVASLSDAASSSSITRYSRSSRVASLSDAASSSSITRCSRNSRIASLSDATNSRTSSTSRKSSQPFAHEITCGSSQISQIALLMKGGGSENMSCQFSLPDAALGAGRDLEGVRRAVLAAVQRAQGFGCAPGILGVSIGGDRASGFEEAKLQLLRNLDDTNADPQLARLERRILREANTLGIGPMGLGGKTTLLAVKIGSRPRVPASFFVTVAYLCWAARRRTLTL